MVCTMAYAVADLCNSEFAVKLIGKLQDGTVFVKKGHDDSEELFEFKTDEGN